MAYDKSTDYQDLINKAVAAGDYTSAAKYEQQRNEKIADLDASGTNTYGATATNNYSGYLDSGSSSSGSASSGSAYSGTASSGVKVANKAVQADMSRDPNYANQTVWKNGYAITYDENGYATKAVRSESPYYVGQTDPTMANNGYTTDQNMWTDEGILTPEDLARVEAIRAQGAAGTISWAEANAQANAIRQGYGYTITQDGTVVDQQAVDRATAAQQATGATVYYDRNTGTYLPITSAPTTNVGTVTTPTTTTTMPAAGTTTPATGGTTAANQVSLPDLPGLSLGGVKAPEFSAESVALPELGGETIPAPEFETGEVAVGSVPQYEVGDYSQYIKDLYAANVESELAALEDAYKANVGTLKSAGERIGETYQTAQNAAAAQNAVARRNMQEVMAANGLNTGTAGQAALAQSAALQSQLGSLSAQEAQAITDNQREQDELERQYQSAIVQAKANGNSALAAALYEEMIRQDSARQSAAQAAREQANFEAQFALSQQQNRNELLQQQYANALNQQQYQNELAQQQYQNELAQQQYADQLLQQQYENAFAQQQYGNQLAQQEYENLFGQQQYRDQQTQQSFENDLLLRQYEDALAQQAYENALAGTKSASSGSSGGSGGSGGTGSITPSGAGEYAMYLDAMNSGMDPRTYVKSYYKDYGMEVLPNESAYESWEKALPDQLGSSAFQTWLNKVNINLSESTLDSVDKMVSQYWPVLTDAQRESVQQLFSDYGQIYRYE